MSRSIQYLSVLRKLRVPQAMPLPPMHPVPSVPRLISVYVRDALTRLEETKAKVTSIFGDILKMNSSKKESFLIHPSMLFILRQHKKLLNKILK